MSATIEQMRSRQDVPVVIAEQDGCISYVNTAFEAVFGWTAKQVVGQSLAVIMPARLRDAHNLGFSRFLTTGVPTVSGRPLMLKAVTKDGREFDAEHLIVAEQTPDGWRFGATIRPLASSASAGG